MHGHHKPGYSSAWNKIKRARNAEIINDVRKKSGCVKCGEKRWQVLEFHHRDGETKKFCIGLAGYYTSEIVLCAEMAKCDILCANCHRMEEWERRNARSGKVVRLS